MQISDTEQECLNLFDPNTYQEGQGPRLGNCYQPPTYEELMAASTDNQLKLLPNNREKFFEFILKEQQVRLNPKVQQLYKDMNHSSAVEHAIHSELLKTFGYDDCPLNHKLYFALTRKYSNDPELKPQIFFWRNNVMHGSRVKLNETPPPIPLLTLDNKELQLEQLLQSAQEEKKLCVIFAGSYT
ncbi:unnamed protein product [Paramecium primaurelia]|uniref:Uncharacterized protein n=1 Tax=Paramecium primaurelia TaxID=5886 RepID=A0A8S1N7U2_PARPR|nr:unnamed protein product [Paramecium primaurelia]CAD8087213.1 unnamed protein product [Paramecium primaurelia]